MAMNVTELLEQVKSLLPNEQRVFGKKFHQWEESQNGMMKMAEAEPRSKVEWPDFMARLRERWPNGTPGKPLSEIIDEGRGERP